MQEALTGKRTGIDLVALREAYGVEQGAVALELGKSRQTIYRWERPLREVAPLRWLQYDGACRRILARAVEGES